MSKPQPCLRDMPLHIKENIIRNINEVERLQIRKISTEFRRIVDNTPSHFELIEVYLYTGDNNITLKLKTMKNEDLYIEYFRARKGCEVEGEGEKKFVAGKLHMERAILDLAILLKNPKLTIETFRYALPDPPDVLLKSRNVREKNQFSQFLTRELKKLDHKLHVETVEQGYDSHPGYLLAFLPYFQPGTLRKFNLALSNSALWEKLNEMEQWQMAKVLKSPSYSYIILESIWCELAHFEQLYFRRCNIKLEDFKDLCEKLHEKKTLHHFAFNSVFSATRDLENYLTQLPDSGVPGESPVKIVKDPGSDYSFLCRFIKGDKYDRLDLYKEGVDVDVVEVDDEDSEDDSEDPDEEDDN